MITVQIQGGDAVIARLQERVPALTAAIRNSVMRASIELVRYVKENKLSGQVLKVRTGTLRRKISYQMTESPSSITGDVGVKLSYAAAHEFGFEGDEAVRAHLRTIKQAFGRSIKPVTFSVAAHTRHVKLPERSFLRSSLREMEPRIHTLIAEAIAQAVKE